MTNRKIAVLNFYLRLLSIYEMTYCNIRDFNEVCCYFFGKSPVKSKKMRIVRNVIQKIPTSITLLILKTMSVRNKRYGRVASAIIIELAASAGAKKNLSGNIKVYDQLPDSNTSSYNINIKTLEINKSEQEQEQEQEHNLLINFREMQISAQTLLDPYLVNSLDIINVVINTDHAHGCNYGWYKRNDVESFEREFSEHFILPDVTSYATFYRYLSAPNIKTNVRKVVWIGTADIPMGLGELIEGITTETIDDEWLATVYDHIDEKIDLFHPHPSSKTGSLTKISQMHGIPSAQFDIGKVNINDKFIFHSINCSLIYYCLKYDLEFIIYSPRLSEKCYTPYFFTFIKKLEQEGKIKYL